MYSCRSLLCVFVPVLCWCYCSCSLFVLLFFALVIGIVQVRC